MIIDIVKLSGTDATVIQLGETTQVSLDGRPLRRSAVGGRFFVSEGLSINVRLDPNATFRDQTLTLNPAVAIAVNGDRIYDSVCKLTFIGDEMQIDSNADVKRKETIDRLAAELRTLDEQEQHLRRQLEDKQNAVRRLQQDNQDAEQQITRLTADSNSLKQQQNQLTATVGSLDKLQNDLSEVNASLAQAQSQSEALNREFADKNAEREKIAQEIEVTDAAIKFLIKQLANEKGRHDELKQQEEQLTADLANYSPAILETLQQNIQNLQEQHTSARDEWTRLSGEKRVWEKQVENQLNSNNALTQEIARQPEELKALQEAHEALSRRLTETIHAQTMCSEEKQQELQDQINEQEPIARKLTEQYEALKSREAEVSRVIAELQEAKDAQLLQLWPQLTQILNGIRDRVIDMNEELEKLQAEAAGFDQHIKACAERMEQMKEWYHVDKTPLEKLQARLGTMTASENEQLLTTMNPMTVDRVRSLFENTEAGLAELDDLLKDVIRAAQNDEKFVNLKTATNEQHARQEMKR